MRYVDGGRTADVAAAFGISAGSVRKWRRQWREGGRRALLSKGPMNVEKLMPQQSEGLVAELKRASLAHGFADDRRWTLKRIRLLIGRLFHVGYTVD
ncbi:helix-turn-helix domain-containing protein [Streptomyces murinus]|uniref:helix-turn-helix domain-containing protein n=1 Tax=Streptomyces murinus TaxID=33900 RepID=UPI003F47C3DA